MKNTISILAIAIVTTAFIGCGGGSSGTRTNPQPTLYSGDVIIEDESAIVKTYHDADGLKKICLMGGKAHILRKN